MFGPVSLSLSVSLCFVRLFPKSFLTRSVPLCFPGFPLVEQMTGVIKKFFITSMAMWIAPLAVLYGFYYGYIPGASQLSAENKTLISGFIAVISVNLVIGFYICMAMKESQASTAPQPDPNFLAEAKASINQSETAASSSTAAEQTSGKDTDQVKGKME